MGGFNPHRRYFRCQHSNTFFFCLGRERRGGGGGGVLSASRQEKEMPNCGEAACLFTQHKPSPRKLQTSRLMQITWWLQEPLKRLRVCVLVCVWNVCHPTSLWQDEVCGTMKTIMHSGHVSLSRVMGAERRAGWWWSRETLPSSAWISGNASSRRGWKKWD